MCLVGLSIYVSKIFWSSSARGNYFWDNWECLQVGLVSEKKTSILKLFYRFGQHFSLFRNIHDIIFSFPFPLSVSRASPFLTLWGPHSLRLREQPGAFLLWMKPYPNFRYITLFFNRTPHWFSHGLQTLVEFFFPRVIVFLISALLDERIEVFHKICKRGKSSNVGMQCGSLHGWFWAVSLSLSNIKKKMRFFWVLAGVLESWERGQRWTQLRNTHLQCGGGEDVFQVWNG